MLWLVFLTTASLAAAAASLVFALARR